MKQISQYHNWISYVPYPEETPLLVSDLGPHPLRGKVRTLGEVLSDPAYSPMRP